MTAQLISGPADGSLTLKSDGSFNYTPNAGFSGTDSFSFVISDGIKQCNLVDLKINAIYGKLNAATIQDNEESGTLAPALEDTTGAYVPLDNVDQDYDGTPDMNEAGAIQGEKDLLPITIKAATPGGLGGDYTLDIPSNIHVWQNANRSGAVGEGTPFADSQDTKLYVEGISVGSGVLSLMWTKGDITLKYTDTLLVNVFDWEGPQNVPGTGIYMYTASGGADGTQSQWLDPVGGTWIGSRSTDIQYIQWAPGPTVGEAVYQAASGYVWDRDVNVVAVAIGSENNIAYNNPPVQATFGQVAAAPAGVDAMAANVAINLEGPVVDGHMRGVRFM